jgi:hypothetical protein
VSSVPTDPPSRRFAQPGKQFWKDYRVPKKPLPTANRRPDTCPFCRLEVIWARFRPPKVRSGGRAFVPFPVEACAPGTGNIALTTALFTDFRGQSGGGAPPLAELVSNGTGYRSHRDHCPKAPAPPKAFSATSLPSDRKQGSR